MIDPKDLFARNRRWAAELEKAEPGFFETISKGQEPAYLWIGCSDSRVPATQLLGLKPGAVFVHRNIANQVIRDDPNSLAVIHYAVHSLRVRHIVLCGHYHCGGVTAALSDGGSGVVDDWLSDLRGLRTEVQAALAGLNPEQAVERLCEINVHRQVANLCRTEPVRNAWADGMELTVHGWIFDPGSGLLEDLEISRSDAERI